ncbi:MAG: hypothetical protein HOJ15_01750 [Candidatus Jacksonbacteria bacterium]|jgi:hypothetical protein|nr:hypothetical protein [Candidatus Jacksonbacteria bacterium]MBT6034718.1 hypothetical protein [Candidatus Jacksonbacteria bacterium]MBT6301131.1 hypothetical protein [Candidatus Jacksonbacteria bacterium]MBT6955633.1 hypothetical protein [Candidatus Jacksonbacteria bacterium]MBT7008422.1 hypothetical protein [Candidatus Jacksonbacteria bacterium]
MAVKSLGLGDAIQEAMMDVLSDTVMLSANHLRQPFLIERASQDSVTVVGWDRSSDSGEIVFEHLFMRVQMRNDPQESVSLVLVRFEPRSRADVSMLVREYSWFFEDYPRAVAHLVTPLELGTYSV